MKLTQSMIAKLAPPSGKNDAIFFDDDVHGLGLRAHSGGKRTWIFQYKIGSKQRRITFGTAPAISLAAARKTAGELHAKVRLGEAPPPPSATASAALRIPSRPSCGYTCPRKGRHGPRRAACQWNITFCTMPSRSTGSALP